jgi:hypothetical protein
MKTDDELRVAAAAAAKADMKALGMHNGDRIKCDCEHCVKLLVEQYRWHWARLSGQQALQGLVAVKAAPTLQFDPVRPFGSILPAPTLLHVHDIDSSAGIPYCRSCGLAVPSSEPGIVVGAGG